MEVTFLVPFLRASISDIGPVKVAEVSRPFRIIKHETKYNNTALLLCCKLEAVDLVANSLVDSLGGEDLGQSAPQASI